MEDEKRKIYYGSDLHLTGHITNQIDVLQTFTSESDTLYEFGVNFATYKCKSVDAVIQISILDLEGDKLYCNTFTNGLFKDNKFLIVKTNLKLKINTRYVLRITAINKQQVSKPVTVKWGRRRHPKELFCINSIPKHGELFSFFCFQPPIVKQSTYLTPPRVFTSGLVSIVVPVYNSCNHLVKLLESIKHQTYNFLQVIVVDDGSKNNQQVEQICRSYVNDFDLLFIDLGKNFGAPFARNKGFKHVAGEFCFFCDSDVVIDKNLCKDMVQSLHDNPTATWTYCNFTWGKNNLVFHPFNKKKLLKHNLSSTMSMLRSKTFIYFDEKLNKYQDWDLWLRYMEQGHVGVWINKFLFHTVERVGITSTYTRKEGLADIRKKHPMAGV